MEVAACMCSLDIISRYSTKCIYAVATPVLVLLPHHVNLPVSAVQRTPEIQPASRQTSDKMCPPSTPCHYCHPCQPWCCTAQVGDGPLSEASFAGTAQHCSRLAQT